MEVRKFDPGSLTDQEVRETLIMHLESAFKEASLADIYDDIDAISFAYGVLIASGLPAKVSEQEVLAKDFVDSHDAGAEVEVTFQGSISGPGKKDSKH